MKNIIRVTAIILTMAATLVAHPFLRLEAKEIKNDYYSNPSNQTGNSAFQGEVQLVYGYSISDPSAHLSGSFAGIVGAEYDIPYIFVFDMYITFAHTVEKAYLEIQFTRPATNNYPNFWYVGENVHIQGRANTTSSSYLSFYCYDTNMAHIQLIFPAEVVEENYNYSYSAAYPDNLNGKEWVINGLNYFKVSSSKMTSCKLKTDTDYTQYVDGIENSLSRIESNIDGVESLLTSIDSSLNNIENVLSDVRQSLLNIRNDNYAYQLYDMWLTGVTTSANHELTLDYDFINNSTGPGDPNDRQTWYWFRGDSYNSSTGILMSSSVTYSMYQDLKILIFFKNIGGNDNGYWISFPYGSLTTQYYKDYLYIPSPSENAIYQLEISQNWDNGEEQRPTVYFYLNKLVLGSQNITSVNVGDYVTNVYVTNEDITLESINKRGFESILSLLGSISGTDLESQVDQYNNTVDQIHNVEDTLSNNLNNQMQQFNPGDNQVVNNYQTGFQFLKGAIENIRYITIIFVPLTVTLIGVVFLAILG